MKFSKHTLALPFAMLLCIACLLSACAQPKPDEGAASSPDNSYVQNTDTDSYVNTDIPGSLDMAQGTDTTIASEPEPIELPFDITGELLSSSYDGIINVTSEPGGFRIKIGDIESDLMTVTNIIEDYETRIELYTVEGAQSPGSATFIKKPELLGFYSSINFEDQSLKIQENGFQPIHFIPGTFMYYDYIDKTTKDAFTYERNEEGLFRFSILGGEYETDWMEPKVSGGWISFDVEEGDTQINIKFNLPYLLDGYYTDAKLTTNIILSSGYELVCDTYQEASALPLSLLDLTGTYSGADYGVVTELVITQDSITYCNRFTAMCDKVQLLNSPFQYLRLTDPDSGEVYVARFGDLDFELKPDGTYQLERIDFEHLDLNDTPYVEIPDGELLRK